MRASDRVREGGSALDTSAVRDEHRGQGVRLRARRGRESLEGSGGEERVRVHDGAEARARRVRLSARLGRSRICVAWPKMKNVTVVADAGLKAARELVVDDHLAGCGRGARQARARPAERGGLIEVDVPHQGDRLGSRDAVTREGRGRDRVVDGEHAVDVGI